MSGLVLQNAPIAVDCWSGPHCRAVKLYFLTHMHSDHTSGLNASWNQPLYCSPISKKLLVDRLKVSADLVHELELNEPHIIPLAGETITVTPIDARHCPGACMFLFVGSFGKILYTGDFRYCQSMQDDDAFVAACKEDIDVLYIDNTYCSPVCQFGSREEATAEIIKIMQNHPHHRIVIGIRTLGKESMLVDIAKALESHIYVSADTFKHLELLQCANVFTVNMTESRIHAVTQSLLSNRAIAEMNEEMETIVIVPTALYAALMRDSRADISTNNDNKFVVKYSDHSSFSELCDFVKAVQPRKVCPILTERLQDQLYKAIPERVNMSCFDPYLNTSPLPDITAQVPKTSEFPTEACTVQTRIKRSSSACKKPLCRKKNSSKGIEYQSQSPDNTIEKKQIKNGYNEIKMDTCFSAEIEIQASQNTAEKHELPVECDTRSDIATTNAAETNHAPFCKPDTNSKSEASSSEQSSEQVQVITSQTINNSYCNKLLSNRTKKFTFKSRPTACVRPMSQSSESSQQSSKPLSQLSELMPNASDPLSQFSQPLSHSMDPMPQASQSNAQDIGISGSTANNSARNQTVASMPNLVVSVTSMINEATANGFYGNDNVSISAAHADGFESFFRFGGRDHDRDLAAISDLLKEESLRYRLIKATNVRAYC